MLLLTIKDSSKALLAVRCCCCCCNAYSCSVQSVQPSTLVNRKLCGAFLPTNINAMAMAMSKTDSARSMDKTEQNQKHNIPNAYANNFSSWVHVSL